MFHSNFNVTVKKQYARSEAVFDLLTSAQVCLTGATGSLGAHLLSCFLCHSKVTKVYCLVRAKDDDTARQRVEESMSLRGLADIFELEASKVQCLCSELHLDDLGLSHASYEAIRKDTSLYVHSAWPVNCKFCPKPTLCHVDRTCCSQP